MESGLWTLGRRMGERFSTSTSVNLTLLLTWGESRSGASSKDYGSILMTQSKPLTTYCRFFEGVPRRSICKEMATHPPQSGKHEYLSAPQPVRGPVGLAFMSSTCCRREANNFNILLARSVDEGGDGRDSGGFDYCGSSTPGG